MFDDYNYKNTSTRIKFKFIQERDEPMYPWEIAYFLNKLNTVYYKFDLLNSICSAIDNGISPADIFIFDRSLPLYKRYSRMNLLDEQYAAKIFYKIGLPIPIKPTVDSYNLNLLYQCFHAVNSFLYRNHIQPLNTDFISSSYDIVRSLGLDKAEAHIINAASIRAESSYKSALERGIQKNIVTIDDISSCLTKYRNKKSKLVKNLAVINGLDDGNLKEIVEGTGKESKEQANLLLSFFDNFDKITRPLVCARVSDNKFRVLGRSLVNKQEQTGLELKEISKNSPLGAIIEGGAAIYQTIQQERRANELHEIEKQIMQTDLLTAQEKLKVEERKRLLIEIEISNKLKSVTQNTDVESISNIKASFLKDRLAKAYGAERTNAETVLSHYGLFLDRESIQVIDTNI